MKYIIGVILVCTTVTLFTGCESSSDEAMRKMDEARESFNQEKDKLKAIQSELDSVRSKIAALEK